jgi:fatty acyl-CoA reductase
MVESLHYFTTRGWNFKTEKLIGLWECLSEEDKKVQFEFECFHKRLLQNFNFDVRQIDWDRYLFDYLMGVKTYLLQEKLEDLPKARSNLTWLKQLSIVTNASVWALIVRLFVW